MWHGRGMVVWRRSAPVEVWRTISWAQICADRADRNAKGIVKATFHLTISMRDQRATGKIQRNNYRQGSCGPSLTGERMSVSLIFTYGTQRNVKNR